ncbi:MAG: pyridoxal-phosphate dependent enzyme [Rhodospirillaceae bacterium]|jgi:threonine dehydratase|nr:pyridoxal-phosphate dependent enzyme [Rhodospirillaceae bacterium]MBT6512436.1 pyridoxal-phosphate dependent enzyme [Rhodospirillaceae bacterium]
MTPSETVLSIAAESIKARERIMDVVLETSCLRSRAQPASESGLILKCENFQHTGSFKLRGAMSKLSMLPTDKPVITASSGNHGIACCHAAMTTGHDLTVVLPENVTKAKLALIEGYGVRTILHSMDSSLCEVHAKSLAADGSFTYVSPYNDPTVMAGQGTIGLELLEQLLAIDNVFISMGGGGLISGIGSVLKTHSPATRIIGVSATNSAALAACMEAGRIVETEHFDTLADGCAGGIDEDSRTLPLSIEVIDRVIHCTEKEIGDALHRMAWTDKMIVEGAAALAYAAYLSDEAAFAGQTNVILVCGANFDQSKIGPIVAGS